MEGFISIDAFVDHLKREDLVIVPRSDYESTLIDGLTLPAYRRKILAKTWITFSEISKAKLWGDIGQKAVYTIALKECDAEKILKKKRVWKLHKIEVKRIMRLRGYDE